jgi:DNA primase
MSRVVPLQASDIKELVRTKTDLVQLIGETIALQPQRGGRVFKGLCPFHDDHNPSFEVNPERQTFRCWVCNEGGDCFSYLMKYENIGFREALESLAKRAGIELPASPAHGGGATISREPLFEALTWAAQEFHHVLSQPAGRRAKDYLRSRAFSDDTIRRFRLGYHPDDREWLWQQNRNRCSMEVLRQVDLLSPSEYGEGVYCRFVDRVMFPICDERGRMVGFGGRILPDSSRSQNAKYVNTAETPLFHKSRLLFAWDQAREAIRRTRTAVVMEGYADCIKAHQAGALNAVATLGTAATETHVTALKRLAGRVILVYDGDEAGQRAARQALVRFLAQDVDLRILTLPDELDPDEFLDQHGWPAFEALLQHAPEAWEFELQQCLSTHGTRSVDGRLRCLDDMLTVFSASPGLRGSVKEHVLVRSVAERLGFAEGQAVRRLQELRGRNTTTSRTAKVSAGEPALDQAAQARKSAVESLQRSARGDDLLECEFLALLFTAPGIIGQVRQEIGIEDLHHEPLREILATAFDLWDHGILPTLDRMFATLECPQLKRLLVWLDDLAISREWQRQDRTVDRQPGSTVGSLPGERDPRDSRPLSAVAHPGSAHPGDGRTMSSGSSVAGDLNSTQGLGSCSPLGGFALDGPMGDVWSRLLEGLKWRRQRERQAAVRGEWAPRLQAVQGLNSELKDLLRQAAKFHQQRAAQPPQSSFCEGSSGAQT